MSEDQQEKNPKGPPLPEKRIPTGEQEPQFDWKKEKKTEKKEISPDEKIVAEELRREIDLMEFDDNLKTQAEEKAKKIQFLGEDEKIEHLLKIAREKGVAFAVKVAKSMNDPYLLDILHDILAKEGYYKNFVK